jgi:hypothetical protein
MRALLFLTVLALPTVSACTKEEPKPQPVAEPEVAEELASEPGVADEADEGEDAEGEGETGPAAGEGEAAGDPAAVKALMRGHFSHALQAREALIRGDMAKAKEAMKWLAGHEHGGSLPEKLKPLLPPMQQAAKDFAEAETLRDAGASLAATVARCGACHTEAQDGPIFAATPMPAGEGPKAHMQRHLWVAQRMFEGLALGSTELFSEAARALHDAPMGAEQLDGAAEKAANVKALGEYVHTLIEQAQKAETVEAQTDVYGRFLATCATCHRMLGKGPQPIEPIEPTEALQE